MGDLDDLASAAQSSKKPTAAVRPIAKPKSNSPPTWVWVVGGLLLLGIIGKAMSPDSLPRTATPLRTIEAEESQPVVSAPAPRASNPEPTNPGVWVNGYTKKDGTHVRGYYRSR